MPAYSFKVRFVPWIKDGSKPNTIRGFRKHPPRVGQFAYLYYAMRTKHCIKLLDPQEITAVSCIAIFPDGQVWMIDKNWIEVSDRQFVLNAKSAKQLAKKLSCEVHELNTEQKNNLAWRDGFRHNDEPNKKPGCFDIMLKWWGVTNALPFVGNFICWKYTC